MQANAITGQTNALVRRTRQANVRMQQVTAHCTCIRQANKQHMIVFGDSLHHQLQLEQRGLPVRGSKAELVDHNRSHHWSTLAMADSTWQTVSICTQSVEAMRHTAGVVARTVARC
eukprot:6490920-Amphidinium_carterae.8